MVTLMPLTNEPRDLLTRWDDIVRRRGAAEALCDHSCALTYADLDAATNAIAGALADAGVGADCFVELDFERPLDYVVGMLATLKSGGAFFVLDRAAGTAAVERQRMRAGVVRALCRGDQAAARIVRDDRIAVDIATLDVQSRPTFDWRERYL